MSNATLDRRTESLQLSPPIDLASVNFEFVNPADILLRAMGGAWEYDGLIEGRTAGAAGYASQIRTLTPRASQTDTYAAYLDTWVAHETQHGLIAETAQRVVGQEPFADFPDGLPQLYVHLGELSMRLPWFERMMESVIATQATRNEKLTLMHYQVEREILESLGERDFVETGVRPMMTQESLHLNWNKEKLREACQHLNAFELRVVRLFDWLIWQPVGAKGSAFREQLTKALADLSQGGVAQLSTIAEGVQSVVDNLLYQKSDKRRPRSFVQKRLLAQMK